MTTATDTCPIPAELREVPHWLCWRYETRNGKATKVPVNARTGGNAATDNPDDWCDYETAKAASPRYDGIGFVFAAGSGFVGIDLDKSLDAGGGLKPWAAKIVKAFATYTEVSPSGKGVKLWVRGGISAERGTRRGYEDGAIEMYDWGRFFTVTGRRYDGTPAEIAGRQAYIDALYRRITAKAIDAKPAPPAAPPATLEDQQVIEMLNREPKGKGARLWSGNTSGYTSASEADAALVTKIAFYVGNDPARIDAIFRRSGLAREKWNAREDYRAATIENCVGLIRQFYSPARPERTSDEAASEPAAAPPPEDSRGLLTLLEDTISGKRKNAPWPWKTLTWAGRCLLPGAITVLCGGAGATKSMLVSEACLWWLEAGLPFAVFHLEEDREFHQYRALAQLERKAAITSDSWVRAHPDETRDAYQMHMSTLDALGRCIWDEPSKDVTMADLTDWVRDRAAEKNRVIIIDPVTAADSGKEPWTADRRFITASKRIIRDAGASLIVVTHPRDGSSKQGSHIDNMAGGKAYNRLTSNVLWLESMPAVEQKPIATDAGTAYADVNRLMQLRKVRSGPGAGMTIGYLFDGNTLRFLEQGAIRKIGA